jgi:glutamate N-acetyltransferase/amino-acid N-acetyltransferase
VRGDWLRAPDGLAPLPEGGVTTPAGFEAGAAACGLKPSGDPDVGVLVSRRPCVSALVDTVSALPSAAILQTRALDRAGLHGVVVNAGNANAATGSPGLEDAERMCARAVAALGVAPGSIAVSSTGTIGERLDRDRVLPAIDAAAAASDADGGPAFARAICTTDRAPKAGAFALDLPGGSHVVIGAAAKGAGMISPRMATMLAYVTTDAAIAPGELERVTRDAATVSFNRISVDGQMSPSDTLIVFANGEGAPLAGDDLAVFGRALAAVCRWLAIQMVKDGEGADHAVRLLVRGGADAAEAERVARRVGESPLVKTAIFGRDANWGRVSQAVGQALAGAPGRVHEPVLRFDGLGRDDPGVAEVMARAEYDIELELGRGDGAAELWLCDLTYAYVKLNAEYHT